MLNSTLPCLEPEESDQPDLYTTALTVYALTLANRIREARSKLAWLMERSYSGPSLLWWEKPGLFPLDFYERHASKHFLCQCY